MGGEAKAWKSGGGSSNRPQGTGAVIRPAMQDGDFLADVAAARSRQGGFSLWWLAQSGFLICWNGRYLLLDPYLSDSVTKKYAGTDKPHVRMTELVIDPKRLDFVDVVTSSHNHTDHLDPETLAPLAQVNPDLIMVCPEANRFTVRERTGLPDQRIIGLDAIGNSGGASSHCEVRGFEFIAVPASHETIERDSAGRMIYMGFIVKFGAWTIYHSGDTVLYDGMADILRPFEIDLALLPINGRVPARRVQGNLWGREAAQLARDIGARCVIPCHYDLFEFNTETPEEFVATCKKLGQRYVILRNGERWDRGNDYP
jgi:L-ascorbate metabolism protein UlaG (beta-lactamase superfamily)